MSRRYDEAPEKPFIAYKFPANKGKKMTSEPIQFRIIQFGESL
jgi:hypothetical protein